MYASQPLSPVATQHSLPRGRCSLLGSDLHRLDRSRFPLTHLSVTSSLWARSGSGTMRKTKVLGRKRSVFHFLFMSIVF